MNEIYAQFYEQKIEKLEFKDKKDLKTKFIKAADLNQTFNEWYRLYYPSFTKDKIGLARLKEELSKKLFFGVQDLNSEDQMDWYGMCGTKFFGYKIKREDDEDDFINGKETKVERKVKNKEE